MSINYSVKIDEFAERHYIKKFQKKYKNYWDITWRGVIEQFKRLEELLKTDIVDSIVTEGDVSICKSEFRVAGTKVSKKNSGNRCILAVNNKTEEIIVLLVYHKNYIKGGNETIAWKKIIRENYDNYDFCK
ncbi:MAG: hypothetical protein ACKKL6_02730 [Candidatus Komeilibacteria bacterium]